MSKKAKQIKLCKDMQYLINEHGYNYCSLGAELDVTPKSIREWITKGNKITMQDVSFEKVFTKLEQLKNELKKAKDYQISNKCITENNMSRKKFQIYEKLTGYNIDQHIKITDEKYRGSFRMTKDLQKKLNYIYLETRLPAWMIITPFINEFYKKLKDLGQ